LAEHGNGGNDKNGVHDDDDQKKNKSQYLLRRARMRVSVDAFICVVAIVSIVGVALAILTVVIDHCLFKTIIILEMETSSQ